MNYSLSLQTMVVLIPIILEGDASNVVSIKLKRIHNQGTIPLTSCESPYLHQIKYNDFCYPYSFGSMGVSTFPNPNKLVCKIWIMYPIITKLCNVALTSTMCTVYTWAYIVLCVWTWKDVYAVVCVHAYVELISCETWIPNVCGSWHIGTLAHIGA